MFSQFRSAIRLVPIATRLSGISCVCAPTPQLASVRTCSRDSVLQTQKEFIPDEITKENQFRDRIVSKVNYQIQQQSHGRLFAIVLLAGKQFKITDEDLLVIEGYWQPTVGDKLKLEKVLLVGGHDFTLLGTPVLSRDLVSVTATVVEKKLGVTKTRFRKQPRKQYERTRFVRKEETMLRINRVETIGLVGDDADITSAPRSL
ncbi:unnamed protein product [Bemisia tabaci]|uniref:Large ribosomal subunit protein bL21m n=1 Tax=Bemisia tabaci TaxID=7038 RepID=A0A9N9ZZI5_BEMTA|nr:unnamed protein product [Bemisia tabaci]